MLVMPDDFAAAAEELRALVVVDSEPDVVDDFIDLLERLPIASKEAGNRRARTKAVMDVGIAWIRYEIALTRVSARRANSRRDLLRRFRDLTNGQRGGASTTSLSMIRMKMISGPPRARSALSFFDALSSAMTFRQIGFRGLETALTVFARSPKR
jgi:hypothetical protein